MVFINKFLIRCVPTMLLHGAGAEGFTCTGKTGVLRDFYLSVLLVTEPWCHQPVGCMSICFKTSCCSVPSLNAPWSLVCDLRWAAAGSREAVRGCQAGTTLSTAPCCLLDSMPPQSPASLLSLAAEVYPASCSGTVLVSHSLFHFVLQTFTH